MEEFKLNFLEDYSDENILKEIQRVASIVKNPHLTKKAFDAYSKVHSSTVTRRFGNWHVALEMAGVSERYSGKSVTAKQRNQQPKLWSNKKLIDELKVIAERKGSKIVTVEDIKEYSNFIGPSILSSRFGSTEKAIREAELTISNHAKRYTDNECFENLLTVWTFYGRPPSYQEMKNHPSIVGPKAYLTRWKTWRKALRAFVDRMDSDLTEDASKAHLANPLPLAEIFPAKQVRTKDEDKHKIKLGLRYKVLKRDSFKCVLCGRSPANNPGLELHIDHIEPFCIGGKTVEANLRTTCADCNLGKAARIEKA